jgi:hypothetical protein
MIRNFMKADLYFASGAPGENIKIQQTNHFVVNRIFIWRPFLLFVLGFNVAQITHYKI